MTATIVILCIYCILIAVMLVAKSFFLLVPSLILIGIIWVWLAIRLVKAVQ